MTIKEQVPDDTREDDILDAIVKQAQDEFDRAIDWEDFARKNFRWDWMFYNADSENGFQWPDEIRQTREVDAKPCLTINHARQHTLMLVNEMIDNRPSITVKPVGDEATKAAAEVWEGIIRRIEYQSQANDVYENAVMFQVAAGIGYFRLYTDWENDKSFDQSLYLGAIPDPLGVVMDPDMVEKDGSDMNFCFIFKKMLKKEVEDKYPKTKGRIGSTPLGFNDSWVSKDYCMEAEYWQRKHIEDTLYEFTDHQTGQKRTLLESSMPEFMVEKFKEEKARKRKVTRTEVWRYVIVGDMRVESKIWPGKYIPIVRVPGEEYTVDGVMDRRGHIRAMKDPQRMYNYWTPLALDTPIPTPTGWTTMEKVTAGDYVFDECGSPVKVVGESPVHADRRCYKVTFDDGSSIVADAEHLWEVEERGKRTSETFEWHRKIIPTEKFVPGTHFIYVTEPLNLPEANLPLSPYFVGLWVGDGTSSGTDITMMAGDIDEVRAELVKEGLCVSEIRYWKENVGNINVASVRQMMRELGILGVKRIPEAYLRGSMEQRLALLQGLMDTDGSISVGNNCCSFTTVHHELSLQFAELLRTFGIKAKISERKAASRMFPNGKRYNCKLAYQFDFTAPTEFAIFRLSRKRNIQLAIRNSHRRRTHRFAIKSVVEVPSVLVKCITVEAQSHLFLAGESMVPTHNSSAVEHVALQSKVPWLAAQEATEGYEGIWQTANTENYSVLPYNALADDGVTPIPKPERSQPPVMAQAYLQGMQVSQNEIMAVSGQREAAMGIADNERTGAAIEGRQSRSDTATSHYMRNFGMALRYAGRIILDVVPHIYDVERVIRTMAENGTTVEVKIDPTAKQLMDMTKAENLEGAQIIFNPAMGDYAVEADLGPGYATKREQSFRAFTQILTQAPKLTDIIGDILLEVGDFPGAEKAAERLRRMVPAQATGAGPSPQEQMLQQQLQQANELIAKQHQEIAEAKLKATGKQDLRNVEAYNAETKRMEVLRQAFVNDPQELQQIIHQLVQESLQTVLMGQPQQPSAPALPPPGASVPPAMMQPQQGAPNA